MVNFTSNVGVQIAAHHQERADWTLNFTITSYRVHINSWILEKVLKFAQQVSRPGKRLENRDKVLKNDKKS